jgi:transmembrane sensor
MPDMIEHIDTLIARSIENSITPAEQLLLNNWLQEDVANQQYFDALKSTWMLTSQSLPNYTPDTARNWERFQQHLATDTATSSHQLVPAYRHIFRIAAAIILLAGATLLYFLFFTQYDTTVMTAVGEKKQVTLPDGTLVFMNQGSSIQYTPDFAGTERSVRLQGEAFFEVAPNIEKPFVVTTSISKTVVLGTSFDVKAYDGQPVEIAVVSGKVACSAKKGQETPLTLSTGYKAILQPGQNIHQIPIADINFMSWKENKLRFQDTPLSTVIGNLENYFNVNITVSTPGILTYKYTGSFDAPRLEGTLNDICASANLTWIKEKDHYKISTKISQ